MLFVEEICATKKELQLKKERIAYKKVKFYVVSF